MRFGSWLVGLVLLVASSRPRLAQADEAQDERVRFAGTFLFGGDGAEEAARRAAIERTIDRLFFAIRGIARSRLSRGTTIEPWVAFAFRDGKIRVRVSSGTEATSPEQGTFADHVSSGERTRVSQKLAGGKLTQVFAADEGKRVNEWTLAPDGRTLALRVTVSSPKLSVPLVYTLTYKRAPA
jgi:hypothetical protein